MPLRAGAGEWMKAGGGEFESPPAPVDWTVSTLRVELVETGVGRSWAGKRIFDNLVDVRVASPSGEPFHQRKLTAWFVG